MLQRDRALVAKFLIYSVLDSGLGSVILPLTSVFASFLKESVYIDSSSDQRACNVFQHVFRPFDTHARLCNEKLREGQKVVLMVVQALSNNERYTNQAQILRVGHTGNENVHLAERKHALKRG